MLTFLRKIRRSLLETGALRKYLLYTLGEILLVVIGILLALQINNWNEARKEAADEAYILNEILDNLKEDADQLNYIQERRALAAISVQNMIDSTINFPSSAVSTKDFAAFFTFERYYPLYNAFEMMKSQG